MVDNTELNSGTGGDVIASDDIGGIKHQRVKITLGADNTNDGDVASGNPMPVDDASGSLTVDAPVGTPVNVQIGDGTDQALVTPQGDLNVAVANGPSVGSFSTFGHLITAGQNNVIEVIFYEDTPQNLTTVTVTNSGTAVSNAGGALFSSSTNVNGTSKAVSLVNAHYHSGSEMYSLFTATFTAGVASSYQRIGLYDTNDGFFIGYEGTSFGITTRTGTSDVSVAKASFSEDDLTGGASSLFTRAGVPEAIDLTKLNVFRIRFGWFGSAPVSYEVQAPDGHWVTFHKTLFPNLQAIPSIENADLPMTLDIAKTAADATNLQMQTNCWAAGTTDKRHQLDEVPTDASLVELNKSVIAAFNGTAYANVQSTAAGNLKMSVQEVSDGLDVGAGNAGAETQRVSIATDDINLAAINAGQLPDGHNVDAAGDIAHDSPDSGNPVKGGGKAKNFDGTPTGTDVAEDDRVDSYHTVDGRQFVEISHPNYFRAHADYTVAQTNATVKASPGVGLKLYITDIIISNGATAGNITLLDGSGGTVLIELYPAVNGGLTHSFRTPLALTANTLLAITSTTVTTHTVTISGFIAA